jgi:hypothetical protein
MDFIFEQNITVDDIAKVPAPFETLYVKGDDGKFVIPEALRSVAKSVDGLNKANRTLRGGEKTYKEQLAKWGGLGADPDAVTQELTDLKDKLSKGEKINPEKIKEELNRAHGEKLKEKDTRIEALTAAVRKHLIVSVATQAIATEKGVPELLLPHVERQVKMVEDKGEFKVVVVDGDGETRYGSAGSPMTITELVKNLKADKTYGRAFEPEGAGGSGAGQGTRQVNSGGQGGKDLSPVDKIAAGLQARGMK